MSKNFIYRNEDFVCANCGKQVSKGHGFIRDHCPYCLYGLHVDIMPGDRKEVCHGLLKPIGYEHKKGGIVIIYKCQKCGKIRKNKLVKDDNLDVLLDL